MRALSINGTFADLSNDAIGLTWQYFDVTDPARRFNPYSSTIKLPFTPKNIALLGYSNATGARLTIARSIPSVNYYFGPLIVIKGGTLKVNSIEKDGFSCNLVSKTTLQDNLTLRSMDDVIAGCVKTWTDTYANVIASLAAGTDGWLLPRTIEDDITSKTWNIHNYSIPNDISKHELWISAAKLLDSIETLHDFTFSVIESAGATDLQASDLYMILSKLYIPAFNYILYFADWGVSWYTKKLATGTRTINTESFEYSEVSFFAGKTAWDFIKLIGQMTGCIIYFEDGDIVFAPIDNMDLFTPIDLSGKIIKDKKYINITGYEANNYLRYQVSDNLAQDYGQSLITANVLPTAEKELLKLDAVLPGRYYNITEAKTLWDTNYAKNGQLKTYPCILYDNGVTATGITITWTGSPGTVSATAALPILRQWLLLTNYISLFAAAWKGEMYDVEAGLNLYQYLQLRPYKLIRINELGGLCFLNKISNFDPYSGKPAKMQVVRWLKVARPLDIPAVCKNFVDDNVAVWDAIDITLAHLSPTSEYIYFTAQVAGEDFTGDTKVETLADDLSGTVIHNVANRIAMKRKDRIELTGTSGAATIICNGISKTVTFDTTLTKTAENFVTAHAAAYLAVNVLVTDAYGILFFESTIAGTDFTGETTINPGLPDLNGTVTLIQANVTALARTDSILLAGTKGILNITCSGITRPAGFKIT